MRATHRDVNEVVVPVQSRSLGCSRSFMALGPRMARRPHASKPTKFGTEFSDVGFIASQVHESGAAMAISKPYLRSLRGSDKPDSVLCSA